MKKLYLTAQSVTNFSVIPASEPESIPMLSLHGLRVKPAMTLCIISILLILMFTGCDKKMSAEDVNSPIETIDVQGFDKLKADNVGKVLIVNVFATWCPPCEEETPDLIKAAKRMRDMPVTMVGLSIDAKKADIVKFKEKFGITYPIYHITDKVRYRLMADKVPTTVIYKPDGSYYTILMGAIDDGILMQIAGELIK